MKQPRTFFKASRSMTSWLQYVAVTMDATDAEEPLSVAQCMGLYADDVLSRINADDPPEPPERFATYATTGDEAAVSCGFVMDAASRTTLYRLANAWTTPQATVLRTLLIRRATEDAWSCPPRGGCYQPSFIRHVLFPIHPTGPEAFTGLQPGEVDSVLQGMIGRFGLVDASMDDLDREMLHANGRDAWIAKARERLAAIDAYGAIHSVRPVEVRTFVPCGWLEHIACPANGHATMPADDFLRIAMLYALRKRLA